MSSVIPKPLVIVIFYMKIINGKPEEDLRMDRVKRWVNNKTARWNSVVLITFGNISTRIFYIHCKFERNPRIDQLI